MSNTRLDQTPITLYTAAATLPGTGGASVAAWTADGYRPAEALLLWTNAGAAAVTVGDVETGAMAYVLAGGVIVDFLFGGRSVTIDPGESIWCPLPRNLAGVGTSWSVRAPLASGSTVAVTIAAYRVEYAPIEAPEAEVPLRYWIDDNVVRNAAGLPTAARRRFYTTEEDRDAAEPGGDLTGDETVVTTVAWAYDGMLVGSQTGAS